jgi:hypothetical protein
MRRRRRLLAPATERADKPVDRGFETQRAYRRVERFLGRLVDAWGDGALSWADVREGVVAVAELAQDEFGVPVRASMTGHRVVVQVGHLAGLLLSAVRKFPTITNEPTPTESARRTSRFKPVAAWHNCEPEVDDAD